MENSNITKLNNLIKKMPQGMAFSVSDFTNDFSYELVKKSLQRLEKEGKIRRIIRGVYDRPSFSKIINEYSVPFPDEVAKALARNYNWKIAPTGNVALNALGLSTQVVANWNYISSGPYKKYNIGNIMLEFIHRSNKELLNMSEKTLILIQALKAIGRNGIDDNIIKKLNNKYTNQEKKVILEEAKNTVIWIYEIIKKICKE